MCIRDRSDIDINGNPVAANAAFAATDQEAPPKGDVLNIKVDGQQYVWQYTYPSIDDKKVFAYTDMYVPVGMTVTLDISSNDVQHSWWIPELGGKMDGVPGHVNETWFKIPADKAGTTFDGQCAELCGSGHADMRAAVRAVTPEQYQSWAEQQATQIQEAGEALAEQREAGEGEEGQ